MRKITKILHTKEWVDMKERPHMKTYVQLDDGLEAYGYGIEFEVGDEVQVFHDDKWNTIKVRKGMKRDETIQERRTSTT